MWKIHKRTIVKLAISCIGTAALAMFAGLLYVTIQNENIALKKAQIGIATLDKKEKELMDARAKLADMSGNIALVKSAFVSEDAFVGVLRFLENLADKSGVVFTAKDAQLPRVGAANPTVLAEVVGDFASVVEFITRLDHTPYSGVVDQFTLTPASNSMLRATLHYTIFNFLSRP